LFESGCADICHGKHASIKRKTLRIVLKFTALSLSLCCVSCGHSPAESLLARYRGQNDVSSFMVCSQYGCSKQSWVSLDQAEWNQVRAIFMPAAQNAAEERERMRRAVALIETLVGPKAGTDIDRAGATIVTFDKIGQLDCIDEAHNTTTYLRLMDAENLIQFHEIGNPAKRGYIFNRWPHNTAVVVEHETGARYVVDSWFGANGMLPDVVTLETWMDGWQPPDSTS